MVKTMAVVLVEVERTRWQTGISLFWAPGQEEFLGFGVLVRIDRLGFGST